MHILLWIRIYSIHRTTFYAEVHAKRERKQILNESDYILSKCTWTKLYLFLIIEEIILSVGTCITFMMELYVTHSSNKK